MEGLTGYNDIGSKTEEEECKVSNFTPSSSDDFQEAAKLADVRKSN